MSDQVIDSYFIYSDLDDSDQVIDGYFIYSDLDDIELSEAEQAEHAQLDAMAEEDSGVPIGKQVQ